MSPSPTPIGWITGGIAEADSIMTLRLENADWFVSGMTTARKTAALTTAQKRIVYSGLFGLEMTTPATDTLKEAQCELAYYLILHLAAEDRRKGLQAQGVTAAGIVQESYRDDAGETPAFPATVLRMLKPYRVDLGGFFAIHIGREENDPIGEAMEDGANVNLGILPEDYCG